MSAYSRDERHSHRHEESRKRRYSRDESDDEKYHQRRRHSSRNRRYTDEERSRSSHSRQNNSSDDGSSDEERVNKFREILIKNTNIKRELPPDFELSEMMARNTLPCFDRERDFEPIEVRRKFFADARIGDEIACKVLRITSTEIELKPECTLTRYRRCLYRIPFPPTTVIPLCEDLELLACARGDLISATITQIDYDNLKLFLIINNYGVPLKNHELPGYYRKLPTISLDEPDLNSILGLAPFITNYSALPELCEKDLDNPRKGPEVLRQKLKESKAAKLVEQAAEKALEIWNNFVPALVGRSAAFANQKRFDDALTDLRKARAIDPENATALQYLSTVLLVYGQQDEAEGHLNSALEKYREAVELNEDDNRARILLSEVKTKIEEIKLKAKKEREASEKQKQNDKSRKEQRQNSKKLKEMEKFIESLKKKK